MVSVTSSSQREVVAPAELTARIARCGQPVWVLALRTEAFARVAWKSGRPAAETLERRSLQRFAELRFELLREGDVLVHGAGEDVFAFALLAPPRHETTRNADRLRALAGIERAVRARAGVDVVTSWALLHPGDDAHRAIVAAAERASARQQRRSLASLLHDVAAPVSSIYGSLGAVIEGVLDEPTERRYLETAYAEAGRVGRLIRGFLSAQTEEAHPSDAGAALARAIAALEPLARERGARVRIASRAHGACVAVDDDRIVALFMGLIENALKHGRRDGRVNARVRTERGLCVVEIDDDGPGVADSVRESIFDYGVRASPTEGFGIGLAHARLLVEAHDGVIEVRRSPLGGARFVVRLPLDGRRVSA